VSWYQFETENGMIKNILIYAWNSYSISKNTFFSCCSTKKTDLILCFFVLANNGAMNQIYFLFIPKTDLVCCCFQKSSNVFFIFKLPIYCLDLQWHLLPRNFQWAIYPKGYDFEFELWIHNSTKSRKYKLSHFFWEFAKELKEQWKKIFVLRR